MSHSDLETAVTAGEDKGVTAEFVEDRLEQSVTRIEEGKADRFVAFTLTGDVSGCSELPACIDRTAVGAGSLPHHHPMDCAGQVVGFRPLADARALPRV